MADPEIRPRIDDDSESPTYGCGFCSVPCPGVSIGEPEWSICFDVVMDRDEGVICPVHTARMAALIRELLDWKLPGGAKRSYIDIVHEIRELLGGE